MDLKATNTSFQAKLVTLKDVKNKSALKKISREFEKRTPNYPNDALYITQTPFGTNSWHITDKKRGNFYKGEEIFTNSIDEQIEELGVKNFTKKLLNAFKAMMYERKIYKKAKPVKMELDKLIALRNANKRKALAYEENGNTLMAQRYNVLADINNSKIQKLKISYTRYLKQFNSKISQLSKDYPEIGQVELYLV